MSHTKEPWECRYSGDPGWDIDADLEQRASGPWKAIATVMANSLGSVPVTEEEAEANARRIVACVNACRDIPTEELVRCGLESTIKRFVDKALDQAFRDIKEDQ